MRFKKIFFINKIFLFFNGNDEFQKYNLNKNQQN